MQPKILALFVVILPLLAMNSAYFFSAQAEMVPWCLPYLEGCTSISRAGRSGYTIFIYRILVFAYSFTLILFWLYIKIWLDLLHGKRSKMAWTILCLGLLSSISLLLYIDFLGTSGEYNRLLRRAGSYVYFALSPIAQLLLLKQHFTLLRQSPETALNINILKYQRIVFILMAFIVCVSVYYVLTDQNTAERENIVEWNFTLLLTLYNAGMIFLWQNFTQAFTINTARTSTEELAPPE